MYRVPVPAVLLVGMIVLLLIASSGDLKRAAVPSPPPWRDDWQDTFLGVELQSDVSSHPRSPSSLSPFCPRCGVALRVESRDYRTISVAFICDECAFRQEIEGNVEAVVDRVARLLQHKVEEKYGGQS